MKRGLALVLLLSASIVRADVPHFGPRTRRPLPIHPVSAVSLSIEAGANDKPARLLIPRALLGRAAKGRRAGTVGVLDHRIPLVGAIALSLGGLCVVGLRGRKRLASLLVLIAVAGGVGVSMLNAAPPLPEKMPLPVVKVNGKQLSLDSVRVEMSDQGDRLRLILPARSWAELGKQF